MGKGIAKNFKRIYPEMFVQYKGLCENKELNIGTLWIYRTTHKWILNFPTKKHWRNPSKLEYIEAGLRKFVSSYDEKGIVSIAFTMLGCGNGELDWEKQVRPLMERYLNKLPIDVFVYLYRKDPFEMEQSNIKSISKRLRNEPVSVSFLEVWNDINKLLSKQESFITLDGTLGYTSEIVSNEINKAIFIRTQDKQIYIFEEELVNIWQFILGFGFLTNENIPNGLSKYLPYLIGILSSLPYLKPVLCTSDYNKIDRYRYIEPNLIGLQFIPNSLEEGIFSGKTFSEVKYYDK